MDGWASSCGYRLAYECECEAECIVEPEPEPDLMAANLEALLRLGLPLLLLAAAGIGADDDDDADFCGSRSGGSRRISRLMSAMELGIAMISAEAEAAAVAPAEGILICRSGLDCLPTALWGSNQASLPLHALLPLLPQTKASRRSLSVPTNDRDNA